MARKKKSETSAKEELNEVKSESTSKAKEIKDTASEKVEEVKTEVTENKGGFSKGVGSFVAIIIVLILLVVAVFMLTSKGKDEGIDIPGDFEEYETDSFVIGHPEGWDISGNEDDFQIFENAEDILSDETTYILFTSDEVSEDDEDFENIRDGKCEEAKDDAQESIADDEEDMEFKEASKVRLHGLRGCKFELEGTMEGFTGEDVEIVTTIYYLADDNKGYVLMALSSGGDDSYEDAVETLRTFRLR